MNVKNEQVGNSIAFKGKNIIMGVELDSIQEAESVTQQRKRKCSNTEPTVSNIIRGLSSNAVEDQINTPLLDFVEGGFIN